MPSLLFLGGRLMTSLSGASMPKDSAGKQSVMRFIHKRCAGLKIVNPASVAMKMDSTSDRLDASKNCIDLRMLS